MIYLIDKPHADVGLRTAMTDADACVVLIQDGVLLEPEIDTPTYAVESDVAVRGVDLSSNIESIGYDRLVELLFEQGVRSFV